MTSEVTCARGCALCGLRRAGSASSRPCANSGMRHSGGTGPAIPLSCIMAWMVTLTSRLALMNSSTASGSSMTRAVIRLMMNPREP